MKTLLDFYLAVAGGLLPIIAGCWWAVCRDRDRMHWRWVMTRRELSNELNIRANLVRRILDAGVERDPVTGRFKSLKG